MFNIGSGEFLVIFLIALIVLGPEKLPDAAKKVGKVMGDLRKMSTGFQQEMRQAMDVEGLKKSMDIDGIKQSLTPGSGPTLPAASGESSPEATTWTTPQPAAADAPTEIVGSVPNTAPATPGAGLKSVPNPSTSEPQAKGQQGAA